MRMNAIVVNLGVGETLYFKHNDELLEQIKTAVDSDGSVTATDLNDREITFTGAEIKDVDVQRIEDSAVVD
ncbi:hypothetical protein [Corynebacterium tapiri]|uniref:Uncharacterized protein n=1 Tax=Corynebacterium tapiri TaxID=1448266 RepID=A0A5C4U3Q5_9CORY|nr:hypothetical protein [Corynebacterium tapiri]TNL96847.1 hypothetical protein FHE74_07455 [Corynebacterium tapiri]